VSGLLPYLTATRRSGDAATGAIGLVTRSSLSSGLDQQPVRCNELLTAIVIKSEKDEFDKRRMVMHNITHGLPIVGGLIDSVVGIATGAYYGISGATHAVVASLTGGRA
jgi:hypothetical protein